MFTALSTLYRKIPKTARHIIFVAGFLMMCAVVPSREVFAATAINTWTYPDGSVTLYSDSSLTYTGTTTNVFFELFDQVTPNTCPIGCSGVFAGYPSSVSYASLNNLLYSVKGGPGNYTGSIFWCDNSCGSATSTLFNFQINVIGINQLPPVINPLATRFTSQSLSTSTQIWTVNGYANPIDFAQGLVVSMNVGTPIYPQWDNVQLNVASSGNFTGNLHYQNFSTTTGQLWTFDAKLFRPSYGISPFDGSQIGSTTQNYLLYDEISTTTDSNGLGTTTVSTGVLTGSQIAALSASLCNVFSGNFDLQGCIGYLLYPSPSIIQSAFQQAQATYLQRFPLGYVNRFFQIISTSSPSEPPPISYTFGSASPSVLQGLTYTINPFDSQYLGSSSPLLQIKSDQGDNKNIWDIVDPWFTMATAFAFLGIILKDLFDIDMGDDSQLTETGSVSRTTTGRNGEKINHTYRKSRPRNKLRL